MGNPSVLSVYVNFSKAQGSNREAPQLSDLTIRATCLMEVQMRVIRLKGVHSILKYTITYLNILKRTRTYLKVPDQVVRGLPNTTKSCEKAALTSFKTEWGWACGSNLGPQRLTPPTGVNANQAVQVCTILQQLCNTRQTSVNFLAPCNAMQLNGGLQPQDTYFAFFPLRRKWNVFKIIFYFTI